MTILWMYESSLVPERGGTERITNLIMNGLSNRGYICMGMLVVRKNGNFFLQDQPIPDLFLFLKKNNVKVVINQMAYQQWLLDIFLSNGGQKWHQQGGMIISCLHFDPKMPNIKFLFKYKRSKTWRDWISLIKLTIFNHYYEKKQEEQLGVVYREIYTKSDYFVALSKTHFPYLKRVMQLSNYNKLVAIGNPLTFDVVSDDKILEEKKNVCLVVARMNEYHKRISLILKAWMKIKSYSEAHDWTLKIIGDGPDLNNYKQYVASHHITNIEFLGQQSPEVYYKEAKIYLMTSSAEGWGLTLTESLQWGVIPVVMDSSSVFHEIIDNEENGYITQNNNIRLFVEKIRYLMRNENLRINMGRAAMRSTARFAIGPTLDKWEEMLTA